MKGTIKQVGRYIVGEVVGQGSFGKVYKGVDRFDKSEVALKFISKRGKNKKQLQGLRSQNEMLKKICHRNIIKLLDFLQTQNQMIIITQFAGQNLADVLQKKKKFSYQQVRSYCKQIFDALCYLDQNRIAHRDLKPQNILIQNEVIKICDFGFARKLSASTTFMNSLKGTPLYIAPQILQSGPLNYTKKVDVWSFGIIIYQLLVGRPPFWAQNLAKLKPKILYEKVKFPKQMPLQLRSLIDRMLQKIPQTRADWQELKKNPFFIQTFKQVPLTNSTLASRSPPKQNIIKILDEPPTIMKKQESEKQVIPEQPHKKVSIASPQDLQQIKRISNDLLTGKIDHKQLRNDNNFFDKTMTVFGSYISGQTVVTKQDLNQLVLIFSDMLKKKLNEVDLANDIAKKKQFLFCLLKFAQQDNDPQIISILLIIIGNLIKLNFDHNSVDFQTDQDIIDICVRQVQNYRSIGCFNNALIVLGVLCNQAMVTLNNSEQFFIKIDQSDTLSTIAEKFQPIQAKRVVLQCLQKFIHTNVGQVTLTKNQQSLKKVFKNMKEKVATALLKTNFLAQNPMNIYKQEAHVQIYAKILYECINASQTFRKQFFRQNFWTDFLQRKALRIFCFAYDYICIQKDKNCLIPNQVMKSMLSQKSKKTIENVFFLARAEFYLSKKQVQTSNKQQSTQILINQICQSLSEDQQVKKKASRQIQGFLFMGHRIYEEVLCQSFCNILNDQLFDKSSITQNIIQTVLQNTLNSKHDQQLKVSLFTATRLIIAIEQLIRTQGSKMRTNRKIITLLGDIIGFFLENGFIFQLNNQHGPSITRKFLFAMFNIIKMHSIPMVAPQQRALTQKKVGIINNRRQMDRTLTRKQSQKPGSQKQMQKRQTDLYLKAQLRGIQNLLISEAILDKYTLSLCLTLFLKLIAQNKCTDAIIDFTGITLIDKFKNYLKLDLEDKDAEIVVQMLHLTSLVIKKNQQYAQKLRQIQIITHFPRYLQHPNNQNIRHHTLTLIGNMAKHSNYFFDDFANNNIFPCVVDSVKRFDIKNRTKILKGIVYAVGNVSFYTDRFANSFMQLIPAIYEALCQDREKQNGLISNAMSTVSNLLRHSNIYMKTLIQCQIFKKVLQLILQSQTQDNLTMFGLNMIKKALIYQQIFDAHPKSEFIALYKEKVKIVGQQNQCLKKIRTFM